MATFRGIPAQRDQDEHHDVEAHRWRGRKGVRGPAWLKMPLLTIGLLGAQVVWSTEMGYASPYLLSLGVSKSWMAMVFVAGPLSGLFVQPLIGVLADRSTSKWGRRRPYMLCGSIFCSLSLLLVGFTKEVVSWFILPSSPANATATIWLAVVAIYCVDFSVNALRAVDRALLVDTLPTAEQDRGQAWAGRMLIMGSLVGFWVGHLSLPSQLPFLGSTQLQVLSVLASSFLFGSHLLTAISVKERILLPLSLHQDMEAVESGTRRGWRHLAVAKPVENKPSVFSVFKDIWINAKVLPPNIRRICTVQFFSWIGWFPVLLLSTVYVGEIYTLSLPPGGINLSTTEDATLVGASALFNSSLLSLGTIILLPLIVGYFKKRSPRRAGFHFGLAEIWILSQLLFSACMGATWFTGTSVTGSINILALTGFSFAVTQWVPFGLLAEQISGGGGNDADADVDAAYRPLAVEGDQAESIPIRRSERWTTPDTGLTPRIVFDSEEGSGSRDHGSGTALGTGDERARLMERPQENRGEDDPQLIKNLETSEYAVGSPYAGLPTTANRNGSDVPTKLTNISGKAGVILGIHSASIVIPQFLVTTLSSIIFASYEPVSGVHPGAGHAGAGVGRGAVVGPRAVINDGGIETNKRDTIGRLAVRALESTLLKRSQRGPTYYASGNGIKRPDGIALIFKIGGCSSLIAAFLCWRLARELRRRRIS